MKTEEFLDELCDALGRDPGSLSRDDTPETVKEWDSMGHLSMIAVIDDVLDVDVTDEEIRNFATMGQLIERLVARGALED